MDQIQNYKCPACGAPLVFDGAAGGLHCSSCGNSYSTETMEQIDAAVNGAQEASKYDWGSYEPRTFEMSEGQNLASYSCPSCGAEITGDDTMGSTVCPYCGNSTIVKGTFEGAYMPDFVIPFEIDKKKAVALFEEDAKDKPFLPDEFKNRKRIEEMAGVYVPFWMFDCDCAAMLTYNAEMVYNWEDSEYEYTKTDHYRLLRNGFVSYQNIPVDASLKADDAYMDALEPFDYSKAVNFNTGYLSGHLADKYDVSVEDSIERANRRVQNSTNEIFMDTTAGYNFVRPEFTNIQTSQGIIRYSLLPVWMLNIKFNGQNYKYAVNGQTGKVVGSYPIDKKKKKRHFRNTVLKFTLPISAVIFAAMQIFL
ncbi:MAG: hypothetical protein ACI4VM_08985 [Anaerovoracaceae bacterium]